MNIMNPSTFFRPIYLRFVLILACHSPYVSQPVYFLPNILIEFVISPMRATYRSGLFFPNNIL
jgi:hypothetical protein